MLCISGGMVLERQWSVPYGITLRLLRVQHLSSKTASERGRGSKVALERTVGDYGQPAML